MKSPELLGPFGREEGKWVVFSVGNPSERHGPALPKNLDDLHSIQAAKNLCFTSGAVYGGHFPFTTDRLGEVSLEWSPRFKSKGEFLGCLREWLPMMMTALEGAHGKEFENIMFLNGHGGNNDCLNDIKTIVEDLYHVRCVALSSLAMDANLLEGNLSPLAEAVCEQGGEGGVTDPKTLTNLYQEVMETGGHAGHLEHTLAAAMGVLDWIKWNNLNGELEETFEGTLTEYPALAGLWGFRDQIGPENWFRYNLQDCFESVQRHGKVLVFPNLGALLHRLALHYQMTLFQGGNPDANE